jgi:uncharacterized protein with HEPN domain
MPPEDRTRILHMIDAAQAVVQFLTNRRREDFASDRMLLFAVVRAIEVFGEAASRVSAQTKVETPEVPWPQIVAMRNRLVHAYFDIDRAILWRAASEELPSLMPALKRLTQT